MVDFFLKNVCFLIELSLNAFQFQGFLENLRNLNQNKASSIDCSEHSFQKITDQFF